MSNTVLIVAALALMATIGGIAYYSQHHTGSFLAINDTAIYDAYTHWKQRQNKVYSDEENMKRYQVFKSNFLFVEEHNQKFQAGESTFQVALNEFADLLNEEFRATRLGFNPRTTVDSNDFLVSELPASVDWRKTAVSAVKNQGQCGSCWAFSTTGGLEGLYAINNKKIQTFSEQQLVDCSTSYGNQGCNGGLMDSAFKYVVDHGITTEDKYPYKGTDGTCQKATADFKIGGFKDVPQNSSAQLMAAVAVQPISIAVDAASLWWQFYFGGVFSHNCGTSLDHGVLLVGYGSSSGTNYYIVKNSWGGSWGESGYIRLANNQPTGPGECGLQMQASYPTA